MFHTVYPDPDREGAAGPGAEPFLHDPLHDPLTDPLSGPFTDRLPDPLSDPLSGPLSDPLFDPLSGSFPHPMADAPPDPLLGPRRDLLSDPLGARFGDRPARPPGAPRPEPGSDAALPDSDRWHLTGTFTFLFPAIPLPLAHAAAEVLWEIGFSDHAGSQDPEPHGAHRAAAAVLDAADVLLCTEHRLLEACPVLRRRVEAGTVPDLKAVVTRLAEHHAGTLSAAEATAWIDSAVLGLMPTLPPPMSPATSARLRAEAEGHLARALAARAGGDRAGARLTLMLVVGGGDPELAAEALVLLGWLATHAGDHEEAKVWYGRASTSPDARWARAARDELGRLG